MTTTMMVNAETFITKPDNGGPGATVNFCEIPKFNVQGILYFGDGDYIFRYPSSNGWMAKCVTSLDVSAAFSAKELDTGWLPAGVVRTGSNAHGPWYVYSTPPQRVDIVIGDEAALTIPIPRVVMAATLSGYYLWALETMHFEPNASAYQAPFPNVSGDGKVCWGLNAAPAVEPQKARAAWEMFFSTPFNQDLSNGKSRSQNNNVTVLLRQLAGKRSYPVKDLQPFGSSISALVARAIERGL